MEVLFADSFFKSLRKMNSTSIKIKNFLRDIQYGFERLFILLPLIWQDRDWDFHYTFEILKKKCELQARLFRKYGHGVDSDKYAEQLERCAELIKRLNDDDYMTDEYRAYLNTKSIEFEKDGDFYKMINDDSEEHTRIFQDSMTYEEKMKTADKQELFDLIKENYETWWD